ncbi:hypothetical protein LHL20_17690 [Alteromonas sp. McT4-15]|uniref:hypothetical protein n=1 Tax=Alteromonas sp. McT4-15 TaxID=2881256 RepID=UPI001CF8BB6E|nr:hypothetical protein [Alteromonas sp. McT4-15]MCB4438067.1 hypothetical protein [Alteromonas sp. McT4-15]
MTWDVYNSQTDLHDGSYENLSDARFFQMIHTVLWKGSEWVIRESRSNRDRFHADYEVLLISTFGEPQNELLAKIQQTNLSFTNVRWLDDILVFESHIKEQSMCSACLNNL